MALKLVINVAKKIPGPEEYSSVQASCSLEGELLPNQDAGPEAARLFAAAEQAVDRQLGVSGEPVSTPTAPVVAAATASAPPRHTARPTLAATDSQLRLLRRLVNGNRILLGEVLAEHQVGQLEELSIRQASQLIDRLKGPR